MTSDPVGTNLSRRLFLRWTATVFGAAAVTPALRPLAARAQEGDWTAPPDMEKAKAQATEFVTYGMPDDWANYGEIIRAFGTMLGIEIEHTDTDMSSMEEITKYDAEKNNPAAMTSDIGIIYGTIAEEWGVVPPYMPPRAEVLPAGLRGAEGGWVATFTGVPGFVVNTDVISNVPQTWEDLLNEEYKGKINFSDPRTSGTGASTLIAWAYAAGGDIENMEPGVEFGKKIIGQSASAGGGMQTLEKGEVPIQLKYDFNANADVAQLKEKGINAVTVIPGVSIYAPSAAMINKHNTEKMDAAKLYLDFLLSDEAQTAFARFGARPIRSVLGDLELPAEATANWLPEDQYADVVTVEDWSAIDADQIAALWEDEVLGG